MFIKLDNQVPKLYTIGRLRKDNPNVSFPRKLSDETLANFDVYRVNYVTAEYDENTQYVLDSAPTLVDGQWTITQEVHDHTEEQIAYKVELKAQQIRNQRDGELARTDWYATRAFETGVAMDAEWATYRQALRDITSDAEFPNVTLPVAPDAPVEGE